MWSGSAPTAPNWKGDNQLPGDEELYTTPSPATTTTNPSIGIVDGNLIPLPTSYNTLNVSTLNSTNINNAENTPAVDPAITSLRAELAEVKNSVRKYDLNAAAPANSGESAEVRAFMNGILRGDIRSLTSSTSNAAIPTDLERAIWQKVQQSNVIRALCNPVVIDSSRDIVVEGSLPTTSLVA